jgi:hypothetical protein
VGQVWTPEQIQQQVNLNKAGSQAQVEGQLRNQSQAMAGQGYGANSPLYQALQTSALGQNRAGNVAAENNLRWQAAQGNAQQLLQTQQAAVQQANLQYQATLAGQTAQEQADEARRQLGLGAYQAQLQSQTAYRNALLQAMYGYNQPLQRSVSQSTNMSVGGGGGGAPQVQQKNWLGDVYGAYGAYGGQGVNPYTNDRAIFGTDQFGNMQAG